MGLLDGKKGVILNIANDRSIAAHVAHNCVKQGATCGFGFLPMDNAEKSQRRVRKAMEEYGFPDSFLHPCDVSSDEQIESFFAAVRDRFGTIDFLVHSLAFADRTYLARGKFLSTPRDVFKQALDISAFSLIALTRAAAPLMPEGGSIIAMTYLGSTRAVPGYNVMGVAKAALESTARYLAAELGEKKIRVNTVSAGPVRTLSAMAVGGIDEMFEKVAAHAPLRRNIEADEVGKTSVYLLSDLSSGVTGENIFVDSGVNIVGG
ncbi:MAG TPA: enoyl-ACP reductase [Tepidisphaeraceae bacterium]|nr:enoyl-ACP reductase [Tepidisphaeraceae bacterium]